jgi:transketolase
MRRECAQLLLEEMSANDRIRVITADLGFGVLDHVRNAYPDRFYNVGAAEQLMIGVAVGMAEQGLIPVCYSMSSFLLYRPFEMLRNYVDYEKINVKLLGSGRDRDYSHDGITHWAHDDEEVLSSLPNISVYKPKDLQELKQDFTDWINGAEPAYLNLRRAL